MTASWEGETCSGFALHLSAPRQPSPPAASLHVCPSAHEALKMLRSKSREPGLLSQGCLLCCSPGGPRPGHGEQERGGQLRFLCPLNLVWPPWAWAQRCGKSRGRGRCPLRKQSVLKPDPLLPTRPEKWMLTASQVQRQSPDPFSCFYLVLFGSCFFAIRF